MLQQYLKEIEKYDGTESICSETTVASEEAERQIAIHNENFDSPSDDKLQVVNILQVVDAVNVFGDEKNEGERIQELKIF